MVGGIVVKTGGTIYAATRVTRDMIKIKNPTITALAIATVSSAFSFYAFGSIPEGKYQITHSVPQVWAVLAFITALGSALARRSRSDCQIGEK